MNVLLGISTEGLYSITVDGLFDIKMHVSFMILLIVSCLPCSLLMAEQWFLQRFLHAVVCLI